MLSPRAGAAGDGSKLNFDETKVASIETIGAKLFEKRAIGVVEDHAQANHSGQQSMRCKVW
jgi:hypothetical protein